MYYVYMYIVFIVINVCKLLHVRRPTSSPRAVWNPCKINKALKIKQCLPCNARIPIIDLIIPHAPKNDRIIFHFDKVIISKQ